MSQTLHPTAVIDILSRLPPDSPFVTQVSQALDRTLVPAIGPASTPTGRPARLLTIALAVYDDFDGAYFTIQSIRMFHPEVANDVDFLLLDNHPDGAQSESIRSLCDWIPGLRYLPYSRVVSTAARDVLFREATSEFVLCVDSHVLIPAGGLSRLIDYLKAHRDTRDLLQGPLICDDLRTLFTHFATEWRGGMYGTWATDDRGIDPDGEPFEIPMQGLGLFVCRRDAWPGLNPRMSGFGGEEGYLHEKVRRGGGRVLCLPFLGWVHRFRRANAVQYPNLWDDRIRNYVIAFDELGWDLAPMIDHFRTLIGTEPADRIAGPSMREIASPFHRIDAVYVIHDERWQYTWSQVTKMLEDAGIPARVRRYDAIATPSCPEIGYALSHRAIVDEARRHGLGNVLVLDSDAIANPSVLDEIGRRVGQVTDSTWSTLLFPARSAAIAYNRPVFESILAALPATPTRMALWLRQYGGIVRFCANHLERQAPAHLPGVAAAPCLL